MGSRNIKNIDICFKRSAHVGERMMISHVRAGIIITDKTTCQVLHSQSYRQNFAI